MIPISKVGEQRVSVTVPGQTMAYAQPSPHWGGPYAPPVAPVHFQSPASVRDFPGCFGAIVEGGALEIRRHVGDAGDYVVVHGFGPGGWLEFQNAEGISGG